MSESQITVIYNGIDSEKFHPLPESERLALRQTYQIPAAAKCLVYVGSGFERKGLAAAIMAVSRNDAYLLVVGQDKAEKKYRQLAASLGCADRIRFAGMQKQTLPFYQMSDGLLLPTLYDPFPNVVPEAMACALPVITSTTCGGAEFISQGEEGFVCDALDIGGLAEAVSQLPCDHLSSRMSECARQRVLPYTPAALSQQLIDLYGRVLA